MNRKILVTKVFKNYTRTNLHSGGHPSFPGSAASVHGSAPSAEDYEGPDLQLPALEHEAHTHAPPSAAREDPLRKFCTSPFKYKNIVSIFKCLKFHLADCGTFFYLL